jgi:purine-binding chemotaxis protein CheW
MRDPQAASLKRDDSRRFLTFRLDQRLYAVAAEDVFEVIRRPGVARVPQAPKALVGIANVRGAVVPLASLRGLLGLDDVADDENSRALMLDAAVPAAVAIDSVAALVSVAGDKIETRQTELAAEKGEQLTGAFDVPGEGVAKILNVEGLLERAFAQRAQKQRARVTRSVDVARQEHVERAVERDILVTFDVAGQEYALNIAAVQEIVPTPDDVTPIPHAETLVIGMMAFRDRLLPLLSLRALLGLEATGAANSRRKVIVASVGGATVGLVADHARAIISADRDLIDPIPAVLAARSGGESRISAIYRGDGGKRLISILAPDQLFREDVMQRLGTGTVANAPELEAPAAAEQPFLVFKLGGDEFGLPIQSVDEVARVPEQMTRLPKTPKFLEGVINLRGEVLPVVDQRKRFDMPKLEGSENRRLVVVRTDRHRAGLIVDSVSQVLRSTAAAVEAPPDLTGEITRLVHGVINLETQGRIILLLDPAELLTRAERGLLDAFQSTTKAGS